MDDPHPVDEPYAVTLPALAPPDAVVGSSWVPVAAVLFVAPAVWPLLLMGWGLPHTTYPENTSFGQLLGELATLVGAAAVGLLVGLGWGLVRRSMLAWTLSLGVCALVVITSGLLLAGGGWSGLDLVSWGSAGAMHGTAAWLLLRSSTRREFTHEQGVAEEALWQEVLARPDAPAPAPAAEAPVMSPYDLRAVPRAARTLWDGLGDGLPKLLFGAGVLFAVAAGTADKVNGSLTGQNVQHTRASLTFMAIALALGLAAAVTSKRRRDRS